MDTISLRVTSKVLAQIGKSSGQEQIALRLPSENISRKIGEATKRTKVKVRVAEQLDIWIGDTGAVWRSHNLENVEAFDSLFSFLSEHPDKEFVFVVRGL